MDIAVLAQLLSSLATFVVAAGILYQGRGARKASDDEERTQIIVDADYTGRFTTNVVVRNIGHGIANNITFEFSAPLQSTSGYDIIELPYFKNGINLMAPQTDLPTVWDWGTLRNLVDDQPSVARRERVLGVQGLRGRGAGTGGSSQGHGEDLRRHQRGQRNGKPTTRRAGNVATLSRNRLREIRSRTLLYVRDGARSWLVVRVLLQRVHTKGSVSYV